MFRNDYSVLCCKEVLEALAKYSSEENVGYGLDSHSMHAKELILDYFGLDQTKSDVHFLGGGTQTNAVVISYYLKPYECVIACDSGHINVHETGAIEGTGHKVLTVINKDGKIKASDIKDIYLKHADEHMVKPKMVYISDSTETGTVYTKEELLSIRKVCDEYNLLLFIDGARLAIALSSINSDVDAKFIGEVADVFYAGGTKNGLLYGEAIVIKDKQKASDFRYHIKNRGAMLAKGFLLGIQFETLFTNNLFLNLASSANNKALYIKEELKNLNIELVGDSNTNQLFIRVNKSLGLNLINKFGCEKWSEEDDFLIVRIVTSFATTTNDIEELIKYIKGLGVLSEKSAELDEEELAQVSGGRGKNGQPVLVGFNEDQVD